jgi:rubrerythrin
MTTQTNNICLRCGYSWLGRKKYSRACPLCKSYQWREAKKQEEEDGRV